MVPEVASDVHPATGNGREIMLQGFNWESWKKGHYRKLAAQARGGAGGAGRGWGR